MPGTVVTGPLFLVEGTVLVGHNAAVLVEGDAKKSSSQWMGKTDGGITVVWEKSGMALQPGDLLPVTITNVSATTLFGQPVVL